MDSFNNTSKDEDKILDKIYKKPVCLDWYYDDLIFLIHYTKMHTNL